MQVLRTLRFACVAWFLAAPLSLPAQHDPHRSAAGARPKLGTVDFPNTGAKAAQEPFLLGVALLHSFEYEDAATAFRAAQKADPRFALAYWGEALTFSHIVWGTEDLPASRAAMARLTPAPNERLARAGNARERAFGAAVEALMGDGAMLARTRAYADSMRAYANAVPGDLEAAAFASHAAMVGGRYASASEAGRRFEDATSFAERVFAARPDHPGGAHYLIHATDSPRFASRGLTAARAYDKIAPDAEHALHMPSHIFLQLGMWDDVVASNERAWPASRGWVTRGGYSPAALSWHSLQWLEYGYLQQGRYRAARALIDTARVALRGFRSKAGDYPDVEHAIEVLSFLYASETGQWDVWPADATQPLAMARAVASSPTPRARSMNLTGVYQTSMAAILAKRDPAAAAAALRELVDSLAGAGSSSPPPASARGSLDRLVLPIDAMIAHSRGDRDGAVALLTRAARNEAQAESGVTPVGPPMVIPINEALGSLLLEAGLATDAVIAYERALAQAPGRSAALLGLARAKKAAGDQPGARATYAKLLDNWHGADTGISALTEARTAAAATSR